MNLIHHVPPDYRLDRDIYSVAFAAGCCWLFLLFISETFRDWNRWVPGGLKAMIPLVLFVIGASAALLH